jgi:hypothetical protein
MIQPSKLRRQCGPSGHSVQGGAISLLVAISLGLLASLASFYSARSVLVDRLASHNQSQAVRRGWQPTRPWPGRALKCSGNTPAARRHPFGAQAQPPRPAPPLSADHAGSARPCCRLHTQACLTRWYR